MTIIEAVLLIIVALSGGLSAWILRNKTQLELLQILLSFTGAYLLSVTVTHLVPEVFEHGDRPNIAYFILIGFFVQLMIVQFTRGIEHGHLHLHQALDTRYVTGVVFGLGIHAFLEGIPLSGSGMEHSDTQHIYLAILIHKLPETFSLATVLFFSLRTRFLPWIILGIFALITPVGAWVGQSIGEVSLEHNIDWLLAIVCGTFIHISTTIIFESSGKAHKISMYKFLAILAGVGISLISLIL